MSPMKSFTGAKADLEEMASKSAHLTPTDEATHGSRIEVSVCVGDVSNLLIFSLLFNFRLMLEHRLRL